MPSRATRRSRDGRLDGLRVLITEHAWLRPISRELLAARERAAALLGVARSHRRTPSTAGGAADDRAVPGDPQRRFATTSCARRVPTWAGGRPSAGAAAYPRDQGAAAGRAAQRPGYRRYAPAPRWPPVSASPGSSCPRSATRSSCTRRPRRSRRGGRTIGRMDWPQPMGLFNLAGLPVPQVPLGLNGRGLPLGVQVAAGPGRDHVSIRVAQELERAFGGWVTRRLVSGRRRPASPVCTRSLADLGQRHTV